MVIPPLTKWRRRFVVIRPWSVCIYSSSRAFSSPKELSPHPVGDLLFILPTSNLSGNVLLEGDHIELTTLDMNSYFFQPLPSSYNSTYLEVGGSRESIDFWFQKFRFLSKETSFINFLSTKIERLVKELKLWKMKMLGLVNWLKSNS